MENSATIVIHQTIHGYSDGHSLIASSCEFSSDERRVLLLMSDLSGSISHVKQDPYLTGYPLSGGKYYVFAKTWYASEMRRPGCVWTHSLIVDSALLGQFRWLNILTNLFVRPEINLFQKYASPINFARLTEFEESTHKIVTNILIEGNIDSHLSFLFRELYENPNSKILINTNKLSEFENALLIVWSQQWPRLRRSFSFCTGSISVRSLNDIILDIQLSNVISEKSLYRKSYEVVKFVRFNEYVRSLSRDTLTEVFSNEFLAFMFVYGSDVSGHRSKYLSMFRMFFHFKDELLGKIPYSYIFEMFNNDFKNEANRLKKDFISKKLQLGSEQNIELLQYLLNNKNIEFDVNIFLLFNKLWEGKSINKSNFLEIFNDYSIRNLQVSDLCRILSIVPISVWIDSSWLSDSILRKLVKLFPGITNAYEIWTKNIVIQEKWVRAIDSNSNIDLRRVVESLLDANNNLWVIWTFEKVGYKAIFWCLDWSNENLKTLPAGWERYIVAKPRYYLNWLARRNKVSQYNLAIITKLDLLNKRNSSLIDASKWQKISSLVFEVSYSEELLECAAILAVIGLREAFLEAQDFIALVFQPIHDLAEKDLLPEKVWTYIETLEKKTPSRVIEVSLWDILVGMKFHSVPFWDRCEHMRQLIVDYWILYDWRELVFLRAIKDEKTFEHTIRYCASFKEGKRFIIKLKNVAKFFSANERVFQYRILHKYS